MVQGAGRARIQARDQRGGSARTSHHTPRPASTSATTLTIAWPASLWIGADERCDLGEGEALEPVEHDDLALGRGQLRERASDGLVVEPRVGGARVARAGVVAGRLGRIFGSTAAAPVVVAHQVVGDRVQPRL